MFFLSGKYYRLAAALLAVFPAAACTAAGGRRLAPPQNLADRAETGAVAHFSAPARGNAGSQITAEIISQAAHITLQRRYKYFLLLPEAKRDEKYGGAARPNLGVSYGRRPYGFGDAGSGFNAAPSLSLTTGFAFRDKAKPEQAEWTVYMLRQADRPAVDALPLDKTLLGKTAAIYDARAAGKNGDATPIMLPLR